MVVDFAYLTEKNDIKDLWQHCFCDKEEYANLWFDTIFKPRNTVVARIDNKVVGALQFVYYDAVISNNKKRVAYMCGVGVRKELRGKDIGTKMIEFACEKLNEQGIYLIFLYSKADDFYLKLGYLPIVPKFKYEFKPTSYNTGYTLSDDLDDAIFVYNEYVKEFSNYLLRDISEFRYIKAHYPFYEGDLKVIKKDNVPVAYAVYSVENNTLTVDEVAYTKKEYVYTILDFLSNFGCEKAVLTTGADDEFCKILNNPVKDRIAFVKPLADDFSKDDFNSKSFISTL